MNTATIPARRVTRKANQKPEIPAAIEGSKTTRNPREFNSTQELVIEAVSEMLISGGNRDDIQGLVSAALTHHCRRVWRGLGQAGSQLDQAVSRTYRELFDDWCFAIESGIRANYRAPEPERTSPSDVAGIIRKGWRADLAECLTEFLATCTPDESRFMLEVLQNREGESYVPQCAHGKIFIANAFNEAIRTNTSFIRVPARMVKAVETYISALQAVDGQVA